MRTRIRSVAYGLLVWGGTLSADPCHDLQLQQAAIAHRLELIQDQCNNQLNAITCDHPDSQKHQELSDAASTRCSAKLSNLHNAYSSGKITSAEYSNQFKLIIAQCQKSWSETLERCQKQRIPIIQSCNQQGAPLHAEQQQIQQQMDALKCQLPQP